MLSASTTNSAVKKPLGVTANTRNVVQYHHYAMKDQSNLEFWGYFFVGVLVLFISAVTLRVCMKAQKAPACTTAVDGGSFMWNFLILFSGTIIGLASIDIIRRFAVIIHSGSEGRKPEVATSGGAGQIAGQTKNLG